MTDPLGNHGMETNLGSPHPSPAAPQGALVLHGQSGWRKALRLAWGKKLGGLLVLPPHLSPELMERRVVLVSLPASQPPVPPGRMTA